MLTILIVEDEPNIVELVRMTLEDNRVRVVSAKDGEGGLTRAYELRPHLILLDVNLPDMTGLEVCEHLRRDPRYNDTKIVMLTAAAQTTDQAMGLAAGADQYLTKPFSPVRLLGLVESMLPQVNVWMPR